MCCHYVNFLQVPHEFKFVDDLPMTGSHKVSSWKKSEMNRL